MKVDFTTALRHGWPVCHGWTMTLTESPTAEEVDEAVKLIVGIAPKVIVGPIPKDGKKGAQRP